jgi:hypothetical protein
MLILQNDFNKRLNEKLLRQVAKRGADSPHAEELQHIQPQPAEVVIPQKRSKNDTEKPKEELKENG